MNIFFNILQNIVKTNKVIYPDDRLNSYNMFNSRNYNINFREETSYIYILISDIYNYYTNTYDTMDEPNINSIFARAKLYSINKFLNNIFISKQLKEKVFEIYSKAQNIYFSLTRFMNCYKFKKYSLVVSNDLTLNPLNQYDSNVHIIVQNKSKYYFSINDLINVIESALGNASYFFPEPLEPKNPYNNFLFSNTELYNIYFKMKNSNRVISTLFHLYFIDNFDNELFRINNEIFLRENSIKRYVYKSPDYLLYPSIFTMLQNNRYARKLKIDPEFPKELLVSIFRPFLFYYYIINYHNKFCEKYNNYLYVLDIKLKKFYQFNPSFGRKILKLQTNNKNKIVKKEYMFNSKHINFYNINTNNVSSNDLFNLILEDIRN